MPNPLWLYGFKYLTRYTSIRLGYTRYWCCPVWVYRPGVVQPLVAGLGCNLWLCKFSPDATLGCYTNKVCSPGVVPGEVVVVVATYGGVQKGLYTRLCGVPGYVYRVPCTGLRIPGYVYRNAVHQ